MVGDDQAAATSRYRVLVDRFQRLEESHAQLREEFDELLIPEKRKTDEVATSWGFFNEGTPYRSVLESMGHAVHVCTASSGEIIYWYVIYYCYYFVHEQVCLFLEFEMWVVVVLANELRIAMSFQVKVDK